MTQGAVVEMFDRFDQSEKADCFIPTAKPSEFRKVDLLRQAAALREAALIAKLGAWEYTVAARTVHFSTELWALMGLPERTDWPLEEAVTLWCAADRPKFTAILEKAIRYGQRLEFEGRLNLADASEIWLRVVGEPTFRRGKCVAFRGATQDISEQRLVRELLEASIAEANAARAAKSAFLSVLSHEMRTPLNAMLGTAQVIKLEARSLAEGERVDVILRSGGALLALLDDLLDFADIEAGRVELKDTRADLVDLAASVSKSFEALARSKAIRLGVEVSPGISGVWRCDALRVRQVMSGLVDNALKFTSQGEVRIILNREPDAVAISVADTGPGVPRALQARLFEPFFQGDSSLARRHGGVGLGLAICHELTRLMGGAITVESVVGKGSMFTVRLPLQCADQAAQAEAHPPPAFEAMSVLVAEDNPANQLVITTFLELLGIRPRMVCDGRELVEAWREGHWDLVLTDIQMPEMDGLAATRQIRCEERARGLASTPIVALTANAMSHHAQAYVAAGMNGLIAKPFTFDALVEAIQRTSARRSL
jgi:signal transduction histidine kinase/ActR/RegA family two-component response regulator